MPEEVVGFLVSRRIGAIRLLVVFVESLVCNCKLEISSVVHSVGIVMLFGLAAHCR